MAEPGDAVRFFESLAAHLDTATALRWGFLLDGATEDQVGRLIDAVGEMAFTEVEPVADQEQEGRYSLGFSEVCVHTTESFARRVAAIERLAAREGLVVSDWSAGKAE